MADPKALKSIRARLARYEAKGDRLAVLGAGSLPAAGALWRSMLGGEGIPMDALAALARFHLYRYEASGGDDLFNDFHAMLLLHHRLALVVPDLVPDRVRPTLERGVTIDHHLVGPEHWGRIGIGLLKQAEVSRDPARLDQVVDVFEGTLAVYPPDHRFWPGDMRNLRYALRLRYEVKGRRADRDRAQLIGRALRRGLPLDQPPGPDVPPVAPLRRLSAFRPRQDLERRLVRVSELYDRGEFEVADDEVRDLVDAAGRFLDADDPLVVRAVALFHAVLDALDE